MTSTLTHYRGTRGRDRGRLASVPALSADRSVPALIVKIGRYPLHHGGVGAIRTLGRLGVPVYAITEDRRTPAALSRFTGLKVRSWPPSAGMTACAYTMPNPGLAQMAERFCAAIGFTGVADLDWRLDLRDGQYKLVDFNPRVGAQFRLFETTAGVDVVRALHLDLTGREVPPGRQVDGRRLIVENIDGPARLTRSRSGSAAPPAALRATSTELAWLARDDPFPFLVMLARLAAPAAAHVRQMWRLRAVRRRAERAAAAQAPARPGGRP